jgi:polar amino acid transport system substrate-binding protein
VNEVHKAIGPLAVLLLACGCGQQNHDPTILRWGADASGGGPYIYEEAGEQVGFEVDLAQYLAAELGRTSELVPGDWEQLPSQLSRGDLDIVLNGYEWSPEREHEWSSTIPYYVYRLQLLARRDDPSIQSWDDLPNKRVGVLANSAAHKYLKKHWGDRVKIEAIGEGGGIADVMQLVQRGQLDATVQDVPVVIYYLDREFPQLHRVGDPIAPGYYVIFCRHQDAELRQRLNEAIRKAAHTGVLRQIYEKYGIWTADQEGLLAAGDNWPPAETAEEVGRGEMAGFGTSLLMAALYTVLLSCLAMPLAMLAGMFIAVSRLYGPTWLAALVTVYVEVIRGTPFLLQLFVIYFMGPEIGLKLRPFWAGVLGLALNYAAYESENYRAGMLAIPKGQMEAALALGMSTWTALFRVIIPQAVRTIIPLEVNNFIALFKDTSICSAIAVTELAKRSKELMNDHPSMVLELGITTALLYLAMSIPLTLLSRRLERRLPKVAI